MAGAKVNAKAGEHIYNPLGQALSEFVRRNRRRYESVFGNGKRGSSDDPLVRLEIIQQTINPKAARALYEASWFARNVVDIVAEDMTRNWCQVQTGNQELDDIVTKYLVKLGAQSVFHDLVRHDLIFGNGIVLVGLEDGADLSKPVRADSIRSVRFLNVLDPMSISSEAEIDTNITSPTYGEIVRYKVKSRGKEDVSIHSSRIFHLAMRALYGEKWGTSVFVPMLQIIKVLDSAEWSVGQILYSSVTKVLRGNFAGLTDAEERALRDELDQSLNMLTTICLNKNEEFEYKSPAGVSQGIDALLDFIWECAAGAARVPRTHLIGQQAGAIAGAREDTKTYYRRIAGLQQAYLEPLLKRLAQYILMAKDGGGLSPDAVSSMAIRVIFPGVQSDGSEVAQAVLDTARALQIFVDTGIMSVEEAQEYAKGLLGNLYAKGIGVAP